MGNILRKLLGIIVIGASFTGGWLLMDLQDSVRTPLQLDAPVRLQVAPGDTLTAVARALHRQGILAHPRYLIWYARWEGAADRIQAGEYALQPGMTPAQLLQRLRAGEVVQYPLTIPEGWTFRQMLQALEKSEILRHTLAGMDDAAIMVRLGHPGEHPEGRFYPDTYLFPRGTSDLDILRRAYEAMERRLDREWAQRAPGLPYRTPYEALIMASIIEKETAVPEERPRIAGVFVRRLQRGMRLQTDPTVIYGLGESFDGNLRRRDLERPGPYNTYLRRGLPPTPIALPGGEAIHAALHPAPGDALYFVARGDGSHQFSRTIEEHNAAVRRYQKQGRKQP
ncbi:MAG TPA: endolytic transglycosylase MltG [Gammaproteobacteria bacterium]|nr:endolytic transglycosylase MltG [Gammaproteobacteria bacterium]